MLPKCVPLGALACMHHKMILNSVDGGMEQRYCLHRCKEEVINIYTMSYSAIIDISGILMLELIKIAYWEKLSIKQKITLVAKSF